MNEAGYSYYGNAVRRSRHFRGTEFAVLEGSGEEGDPFREVTYYFDETGALIARKDTHEDRLAQFLRDAGRKAT